MRRQCSLGWTRPYPNDHETECQTWRAGDRWSEYVEFVIGRVFAGDPMGSAYVAAPGAIALYTAPADPSRIVDDFHVVAASALAQDF